MSRIATTASRAGLVACSALLFVFGCKGSDHHATDGGTDSGTDGGTDSGADAGDAGSSTITVQGTVLDQSSGTALAGATVFVTGAAGVITDSAGHFSVSAVTPPYDVAVRAGGTNTVRLFRAVSRSTPTLIVNGGAVMRTAMASGNVSLVSSAAGDQVICTLSGAHGLFGFASAASAGAVPIAWDMSLGGGYSPTWYGPTSADGTIHCFLEHDTGPTLTNAYHGSRPLTVANGGAFSGQNLTLSTVSLATVTGTLVDPDASATVSLTVGPGFAEGGGYYSTTGAATAGAFSTVVPQVPGAFVLVGARDNSRARRSSTAVPASATITQDVTLLARPSVTAPASGAVGITQGSQATWTGASAHLFFVTVTFTGGIVEIVTAGTGVALPDISSFGLAYPAGGAASIRVTEYGLVPSVDSLTADAGFVDMINQRGTFQVATSTTSAFTLAN